MDYNFLQEGYYKIHYQEWWEDGDSKTGWSGSGWGEEKNFEMVEYLEEDKYGNPTKALFRYEGPVFLGPQHAAYNIQASLLSVFMDYVREHVGEKLEDVYKTNPEFKKISDAIDVLEQQFDIKKYLNNE